MYKNRLKSVNKKIFYNGYFEAIESFTRFAEVLKRKGVKGARTKKDSLREGATDRVGWNSANNCSESGGTLVDLHPKSRGCPKPMERTFRSSAVSSAASTPIQIILDFAKHKKSFL